MGQPCLQRRSIPSVLVDPAADLNHLSLKDTFPRRSSTGRALPKIPIEQVRDTVGIFVKNAKRDARKKEKHSESHEIKRQEIEWNWFSISFFSRVNTSNGYFAAPVIEGCKLSFVFSECTSFLKNSVVGTEFNLKSSKAVNTSRVNRKRKDTRFSKNICEWFLDINSCFPSELSVSKSLRSACQKSRKHSLSRSSEPRSTKEGISAWRRKHPDRHWRCWLHGWVYILWNGNHISLLVSYLYFTIDTWTLFKSEFRSHPVESWKDAWNVLVIFFSRSHE